MGVVYHEELEKNVDQILTLWRQVYLE